MSDYPKPCPFCAGIGVTIHEGSTFRWRFAACDNCGAQAPDVRVQTMGDGSPAKWELEASDRALEEWNKRAPNSDATTPA